MTHPAYKFPNHIVAANVLMKLATPFFQGGTWGDDNDRPIRYGVWLALRETAEKILRRNALELNYNESSLLKHALVLCPAGPEIDYINSLSFTVRS